MSELSCRQKLDKMSNYLFRLSTKGMVDETIRELKKVGISLVKNDGNSYLAFIEISTNSSTIKTKIFQDTHKLMCIKVEIDGDSTQWETLECTLTDELPSRLSLMQNISKSKVNTRDPFTCGLCLSYDDTGLIKHIILGWNLFLESHFQYDRVLTSNPDKLYHPFDFKKELKPLPWQSDLPKEIKIPREDRNSEIEICGFYIPTYTDGETIAKNIINKMNLTKEQEALLFQ